MQQKLEAIEQAKHEAIAVVGMGCRFPGANNPEEFWQLLLEGKDAITEVPVEHWAKDRYCNDAVNTPGKICTAQGGFVPHLKEFDASFFRIAPKEAASLDPQQRLLLEISWEALENAGIVAESLQGSSTGVFIGICGTDYWHQLLNREPNQIDAYLTTGNTHSLASGRLSHFYGCTAPSLSLDTACSSSLVAAHLAIKSLRDRECNLAMVGGVNRLIAPEVSINFSQAKMLSPDGRCKTFDNSANGFVRSEGCGIVILKRLSDAIADQDPIKAVLLGSAVNQDGRTSSITTPNSLSQQAVIKKALANSQLEPQQISYLESHGTGTSLGDLIELEALSSVFKENQKLVLGAVKTNIGHLESASGIASLIKTILALQHQTIPANLHLRSPNEQLNWQDSPFVLPAENLAWSSDEESRVAGVSAFGFSGTNAHLVVAEAPKLDRQENPQQPSSNIFTLSARNKPALKQLVQDYADYLANHSELELADICHTVNLGRSHFNHRLACVVASPEELQTKLNQFLNQENPSDFWQGKVGRDSYPKVKIVSDSEISSDLLELVKSSLGDSWTDGDEAKLDWKMASSFTSEEVHNQTVIYTKVDPQTDDVQILSLGLAQLHVFGIALDWKAIAKIFGGNKITLPTYSFQRQVYWLD